ncbi:hypothetical protein OG21DRAFT_1595258 [Imleria badia]|nr:hypothetical protein OG21DRAFT_1595258 [Imleria badia]
MSTTTQILFNSPALHSLKRDQLVKLCKIHSLKASGKKRELIERLQLHAKILPPNDPLSVATRSDNPDAKPAADSEDEASDHSREGDASTSINNTRPSEQWDVVMDTIAEVDEETLRSNRGASNRQVDEFGTTTSKGRSSILPASVTSSLRAIATSLGLKRNILSSRDVVQSSSTLPTSDLNGGSDEPPVEPIPGQSNLQGHPAPSVARLSLSQAPATTTIRLVSNPTAHSELLLSPPKLQPFSTSFDLVPATPGGAGSSSAPVWPLSPGGAARESLYPSVPTFQGFGDLHKQQSPRNSQYDNSDMDLDVDMPGGLAVPSIREPTPEMSNSRTRFNTGATPKSSEKPSAEPVDIFSPAPKPQKASTRSRLGIPRSEPFVFGSPLPQHNMSNLQFRSAAQSVLDEMNKRLAEEGVEAVDTDVLNSRRTTTQESVEKQDSNGSLRVGDMFEKLHQKEFDKMDSITSHYAAKRGAQSTVTHPILSKKRKASLVVKERPLGVPAARHRPNGSRVASGASVKTLPGGFSEEGDEDDEVADRRLSKRPRVEREESDAPAQSDGTSIAPPPDPEEEVQKQKEREAIRRRLEHNKAKRRSSMGRPSLGRAPPPKAKPARFGFFASAKSLVQNVWNRGAGSKATSMPVSKPAQSKEVTKTLPKSTEAKKSAVVPGSSGAPPLSFQTKRKRSGGSNTSVQLNAQGRSTLATPVISGEGTSTRVWKSPTPSFNPPGSSTAVNARSSTVAGYGQSNKRGSSLVGFSSLGRKTGLAANNSRVSSMEPKSNTSSSETNLPKYPTDDQPLSHSSFYRITNSPRSPAHSPRPRPAKIFSQPLSPPPVGPPMSLTTAATSIVGQSARETSSSAVKSPIPPKSKVLPGRRPRISRSKVIARLASQRAAGTSASAGTPKPGGKVRSSMGAEAAGKMSQSYGGARGGDVLMSAKKRVRQSERARRRSRVIGAEGRRMDVD